MCLKVQIQIFIGGFRHPNGNRTAVYRKRPPAIIPDLYGSVNGFQCIQKLASCPAFSHIHPLAAATAVRDQYCHTRIRMFCISFTRKANQWIIIEKQTPRAIGVKLPDFYEPDELRNWWNVVVRDAIVIPIKHTRRTDCLKQDQSISDCLNQKKCYTKKARYLALISLRPLKTAIYIRRRRYRRCAASQESRGTSLSGSPAQEKIFICNFKKTSYQNYDTR